MGAEQNEHLYCQHHQQTADSRLNYSVFDLGLRVVFCRGVPRGLNSAFERKEKCLSNSRFNLYDPSIYIRATHTMQITNLLVLKLCRYSFSGLCQCSVESLTFQRALTRLILPRTRHVILLAHTESLFLQIITLIPWIERRAQHCEVPPNLLTLANNQQGQGYLTELELVKGVPL